MAALASIPVGSLDAVRTVPSRLARLEMTHAFFADYLGISKADLSRLLNSQKVMSGDQAERFYKSLDDLEALARIFRPGKLVWDVPSIKIFVREFVENETAGRELEKSFARLRWEGGFDALSEGIK